MPCPDYTPEIEFLSECATSPASEIVSFTSLCMLVTKCIHHSLHVQRRHTSGPWMSFLGKMGLPR